MRAVITVTGRDNLGIIAKVSGECFRHNVNITDVSQSVLQDFFMMSMLADISGSDVPFGRFVDIMSELGRENNLQIYTMHEDIFGSMHKI